MFWCPRRGADNRLRRRDGAHSWPPTGESFPRASARWTRIPHVGKPTWRRPIGRRSRTRLGRLGQRPSTSTVHLFGTTHKRMFDIHAGNDATPDAGRRQRRLRSACRPMWFTAAELTEIRSAFRQQIAATRSRKPHARRIRKAKPRPVPPLDTDPAHSDADVLTTQGVADAFGVSTYTTRLWADVGTLPSFRTLGGHRRFRWGDVTDWLRRDADATR